MFRSLLSKFYTNTSLSIALSLSAAAWGLYWIPLRQVEELGITSSWTVVIFNACPLIVLCPLFLFYFKSLKGSLKPTLYASLAIGMAFTFYANSLVETTVIRATLLFYLTPVWSTIFGIIWLSEVLTKARIVSITIAFIGLYLLLSNSNSVGYPLNIGDLFGFLSGIFWGIGATLINRWPKMPILPLATLCFIFTTIYSSIFAVFFYIDPFPYFHLIKIAMPTIAFWSILILMPSFCIVFIVSKYLFPGRVGILMMSEVIVAIVTASILIPDEKMILLQWLGAFAIIFAGIYEVLFGYNKKNL